MLSLLKFLKGIGYSERVGDENRTFLIIHFCFKTINACLSHIFVDYSLFNDYFRMIRSIYMYYLIEMKKKSETEMRMKCENEI